MLVANLMYYYAEAVWLSGGNVPLPVEQARSNMAKAKGKAVAPKQRGRPKKNPEKKAVSKPAEGQKKDKNLQESAKIKEMLAPFAKAHGPHFCTYLRGPELHKWNFRFGRDSAKAHAKILRTLHKEFGTVQLPKVPTQKALRMIHKDLKFEMTPAEVSDWVETVTRRLRNLGRVVYVALNNSRQWAQELVKDKKLGDEAVEGDEDEGDEDADEHDQDLDDGSGNDHEEPEEEAAATPPPAAQKAAKSRMWTKGRWNADSTRSVKKYAEEWIQYGFNDEMLLPFRKGSWGTLEIGFPILLEKLANVSDGEEVVGEFPDGTKHKLGVKVAAVKDRAKGVRTWGDATLWQREHQKSGHVLSIKQSSCRQLLMSLYEQQKQVCMVRVDKFGDINNTNHVLPQDNPAVKKALFFMQAIGDAYAEGRIADTDLYPERDARLKRIQKLDEEERRTTTSSPAKRKPAAAPDEADQVVAEAKVNPEPQTKAEVATEAKVNPEPKRKAKVTPEAKVKSEPKRKAKVTQEAKVNPEPTRKAKVTTEAKVNREPKRKAEVTKELEPAPTPKRKRNKDERAQEAELRVCKRKSRDSKYRNDY